MLQKIKYYLPHGICTLFLIQILSIFGFSILYSTLVLYITDKLHINDTAATGIIASFFAFNYVLHLLGGYMGNKLFSNPMLLALGMFFQILGCFFISIPSVDMLYWGLSVFTIGAGTSITCINCMVTQLFAPTDKRRETAFLISYSGLNIIYFIGFAVAGYYQLKRDYHELFLLGALGTFFAFILIPLNWKTLHNINTSFIVQPFTQRLRANIKGVVLFASLILVMHWLFQRENFTNTLILLVSVITAGLILYFTYTQPTVQARNKMWAYLIFSVAALIFWTLYQIAPMALTLFIKRNVDPHYLGFILPPQWVRNVNSVVVMLGAPIMCIAFNMLRARGYRVTLPFQFSISLLLIGISFVLLPIGIYYADSHGYVSMHWVILSYFIQSIGELFISPIGYAMIGELAPANLQGFLMGTWLMLIGIASAISWYFSGVALGTQQTTNPLITNASYSYTFSLLGIIAIAAGIVLFAMLPILLRLTQENSSNVIATEAVPAVS